jgi:hypothetical protein
MTTPAPDQIQAQLEERYAYHDKLIDLQNGTTLWRTVANEIARECATLRIVLQSIYAQRDLTNREVAIMKAAANGERVDGM